MNTQWIHHILLAFTLMASTLPVFAADDEDEPEEEELVKALLAKLPEGSFAHMKELEEEEPEEYEEQLEELIDVAWFYHELKEDNPSMADLLIRKITLEVESERIADRYSEADSEREKKAAAAALQKTVTEAFSINLRFEEMELAMMEAEIKELKSRLERRKTLKDRIIKRRIQELTDEGEDELEWE